MEVGWLSSIGIYSRYWLSINSFASKEEGACSDSEEIFKLLIGKATINSVPVMRSLLTMIAPLCSNTIVFAMASPIPVPKWACVLLLTWKKRS